MTVNMAWAKTLLIALHTLPQSTATPSQSHYAVAGSQAMKFAAPQDERTQALQVRAAWMEKMGLSPEEIAAACRDDGSAINLNEELENLRYAEALDAITPPSSVLQSWAIKY